VAAVEQIGVEAVAKGVSSFLNSMKQMEDAFDRTSAKLDAFAPATGKAVGGTEKLGGIMSSLLPSLSGASGGLGGIIATLGPLAAAAGVAVGGVMLLKKAFDIIVNAIKSAIAAVKSFVMEGMQLAGRFREMEISALAVGRSMGLQQEEIQGAIDNYRDLGIRADVAAKAAASFAKNQIDLAAATDLVRVAQGAAILMGEDSSATMERLTWAVTTQNTRMMRMMGIMVDFPAAQKKFAEANDRSVESLTTAEKNQIALNEAVRAGASVAGIYSEAMKSPTKALRSLTGRELPELKAAIGAPFLQAWATVINAVRDFVKSLTAAAQEGGALYPILVNLGAIASILADAFSAGLNVVTNFISNLSSDLGTGFGNIVVEMARWGAEMIGALAEGIIGAASTALVAAMNFIGSILTSWLGPGSPPKVAPLLDKWGMEAMTEYLKGFTEADFGVLEKIQGPLSHVLDPKQFAKVSADLVEAMSTGAVGEPIFERIAQSAGMFGEEIAELARRQFALAEATKAVEDAENRVAEGRQQVRDLTAEYNQMLRAGASEEQLKAKLAEINAAEEGVSVAQDEAAEAEGRLGQLEEQATLQEKLVGQMLKMTEAVKTVAATAGTMSKAMGKIAKPDITPVTAEDIMPEGLSWDITNKMSEAIDKAKAAIYEKLAYIFQPLAESWERIKAGPLAEIVAKFEEISPLVVAAMDRIKLAWNLLKLAWEIGKYFVESVLIPKLNELSRQALELLKRKLDIVKQAWDKVKAAIVEVYTFVTETFIPFLQETFAGVLNWFKDKILKPFADMWDRVRNAINDVKKALEKLKDLAEEVADALRDVGLLGESPSKFELDLRGQAKAMRQLSQVEFPRLAASIQAPRLQSFTPAMAYGGAAAAGGVSRSVTVQVPITANIYNQMDAESLGIFVEQRVVRAFRRYG
jgi:hypothetical protein